VPFDRLQVPEAEAAFGNSDVTVVTDKSRSRRQIIGSGSSLYALVQWMDLFFKNKEGTEGWSPVFPYFQQGLAYSMEVPLTFPISLPDLPPPFKISQYKSVFFNRIYPILPIFDQETFTSMIDLLQTSSVSALQPKDYPTLACAYAVFSASADEAEGQVTDVGTQYLQGAYALFAHITAVPYLTSVQALLMLTMILRNRNKDGASWSVLGQAIRISQSIGLHRRVSNSPETADLHARIWWSSYVYERIMELETGRPSSIRDHECDQIMPAKHPLLIYFNGMIGLSHVQTRVIQLLYGDNGGSKSSMKHMLWEMGRIDRTLLDWANEFPESIRYVALSS
jgi:hypothetical protein